AAVRGGHPGGRAGDPALFAAALADAEWRFQVLYRRGPGGVGKTALLNEFAWMAAEAGLAVVALDGHTLPPTPAAIEDALMRATSTSSYDVAIEALAARSPRQVLCIDTYEALAQLDTWVQ